MAALKEKHITDSFHFSVHYNSSNDLVRCHVLLFLVSTKTSKEKKDKKFRSDREAACKGDKRGERGEGGEREREKPVLEGASLLTVLCRPIKLIAANALQQARSVLPASSCEMRQRQRRERVERGERKGRERGERGERG